MNKLKILHLSHGGLPDLRIEKTALTMKKEGHDLEFLGGRRTKFQNLGAFSKTYYQPIGNDFDVALNPMIDRKWIKKIDKINPDVIHAHNILVAKMLLKTDYPVIYDDHEYWSKQAFKYALRDFPRGWASRPLMLQIPKWEDRVLRKYPTITTIRNIAREHKKRCIWVGVTNNVPTQNQILNLPTVVERKGIVYTGNDFRKPKFFPHRDMTGIRKVLTFDVIHGLTHREMMEAITKYKIGITPWLPHAWHPYSEANRNYEYLHAGLQVVVNEIMKKAFSDDDFVHTFKDYGSIERTISGIPFIEPEKIMKHAQKRYIWENQEHIIREAYKQV